MTPDETLATDAEQYLPSPRAQRNGIGLCLSGGGFRAALFHLGALRRLNELGILGQMRTISSVSGGSIAAARLATELPWPVQGAVDGEQWEQLVGRPLREFTRHDIRTWPVIAQFLNPASWFGSASAADLLAKRYQRDLAPGTLVDLPENPIFILCATDLAFGVNWEFARTWMGDYMAGEVRPHPADWPIGRAVAASACFPPVFNPVRLPFPPSRLGGGRFPRGPERDRILSDLRLTDGGNYDNMGLEPVWKSHAVVLVSDGGALFERDPYPRLLWKRLSRYLAITDNQSRALRKRWLIAGFTTGVMEGTYWGIGGARSSYERSDAAGYSKELATRVIARVRTDLDAFSEAEIAVLENHGYLLADKAIATHVPGLLPSPLPELRVPHPEWLDASKVEAALAQSSRRRILGR